MYVIIINYLIYFYNLCIYIVNFKNKRAKNNIVVFKIYNDLCFTEFNYAPLLFSSTWIFVLSVFNLNFQLKGKEKKGLK